MNHNIIQCLDKNIYRISFEKMALLLNNKALAWDKLQKKIFGDL
jgi:hypothetical protein